MSKTFKSSYLGQSHQELNIVRLDDGVRVSVDHGSHGAMGIVIAQSDAPALALAILEAAGYTEGDKMAKDAARSHFGDAVESLAVGVGEQERATAEAEAQAKLEAEALELVNTFWKRRDGFPLDNWDSEPGNAKQGWLAVARKAREMRKS